MFNKVHYQFRSRASWAFEMQLQSTLRWLHLQVNHHIYLRTHVVVHSPIYTTIMLTLDCVLTENALHVALPLLDV